MAEEMKYYAMVGGEQKGPFGLEELPAAGVGPDTYVWCRGMADWEKAGDVADICRMYRNRLHDLMHPASLPAVTPESFPTPKAQARIDRFSRYLEGGELPTVEEMESRRDYDSEPSFPKILAIIALLVFPPTGLFALYFVIAGKKCWKRSLETPSEASERKPDARQWKIFAHDYARAAKMWSGISFCAALVALAFYFGS